MNAQQLEFCHQYLLSLNATEAARKAGYKTPNVLSAQLLKKKHIREYIAERQAIQIAKSDLTAIRVLEELRRLAMVDTRSYYDERGNLKPMHELTEEQGSALAGVETMTRNLTAGDGEQDTTYKIKLWDKTKALDLLARHFALLNDSLKVTGDADLVTRLNAARKRIGK